MRITVSSGISEEGVLKKLLEQMNAHVPAKRRMLSDLLSMAEPGYVDKKGRTLVIERSELELVRETLKALGLHDIKLPVVLIADAGQAQSTWRVEGETECAFISAVLGRKQCECSDRMFLYAPHVAELRRKLPTTTTCVFIP